MLFDLVGSAWGRGVGSDVLASAFEEPGSGIDVAVLVYVHTTLEEKVSSLQLWIKNYISVTSNPSTALAAIVALI